MSFYVGSKECSVLSLKPENIQYESVRSLKIVKLI